MESPKCKSVCQSDVPLAPRCDSCKQVLTRKNCTFIRDTCDDCLADQAAEWNNSMDNPHGGPY